MGGKAELKRGPREWASAGGQKRSCGPRVELRSIDLLQLASPGGPERWNNNKAKTLCNTLLVCGCVCPCVCGCARAYAYYMRLCVYVCV